MPAELCDRGELAALLERFADRRGGGLVNAEHDGRMV